MNANYTYRSIDALTAFLKALLGLGVAITVVALLSSFMQAELLSRSSFTEAEAAANDVREGIIGLFQVALYLFTAVTFGCWIVRANRNVRALGANGLRITPGWAVGYFFVPIAYMWKPYQAMRDLWQASRNPTTWRGRPTGCLLPAWWTLWLLSIFLGKLSCRLWMDASEIEALRWAAYVQIAAEAVDIPLCLVALNLISQIARDQARHAQALSNGMFQTAFRVATDAGRWAASGGA